MCSGDVPSISQQADHLAWWQNEESELEGRASVDALQRAVVERNVETLSERDVERTSARGVVEDMVLLQFVSDASSWDELWKELSEATGRPDVSGLVDVESRWLDFTRQAREMARRIYRRALGGRQDA
ncbi:MAG: hypothetical protein ACXADY_27090 [Candidatus Hodarchaeales archaeon]